MTEDRPRSRRRGRTAVAALVPLAVGAGLVWLVSHGPAPESTSPAQAPRSVPASAVPSPTAPHRHEHRRPLAGKVIVLDPGHNPSNRLHTAETARTVDIGTGRKRCDTTGTATASGYAEAAFTLDLARRVRTELEKHGATVRLTQNGARPWGPCIDERAAQGNEAGADAAVSLHADGAGAGNRGFHVIAPARVRAGTADTRAIVGPSRRLGRELADAFGRATGTRPAPYAGGEDGLVTRDDLGGLNLSTVPKVFLECGNMRDPRDAALLKDPAWRTRAAHGVVQGLAGFLGPRENSADG
ncbi:N-acetylmuramoyl-L-alanine amidase [Streptomyces sp. TR06-5]|uniref:N-acetylmuramoyl-L-alanine amidase n=1 Tax=unclassified Streptomyces TaxID=2593676 RepID=UPI0039A0C6E4